MDSPDYNRFLALQLKMQKARGGFEVQVLSSVEFEAVIFLTYELRQFVIKPGGICPAFDSILIPIASITSMTTVEPSANPESNPQVCLRFALPPFSVSISFSRDCRSFTTFVELIEFLRMTLNPPQLPPAHREIQELREANDELTTTVEQLKNVKSQQEAIIQELSRLLASVTTG
jgi:hypothetical protein